MRYLNLSSGYFRFIGGMLRDCFESRWLGGGRGRVSEVKPDALARTESASSGSEAVVEVSRSEVPKSTRFDSGAVTGELPLVVVRSAAAGTIEGASSEAEPVEEREAYWVSGVSERPELGFRTWQPLTRRPSTAGKERSEEPPEREASSSRRWTKR